MAAVTNGLSTSITNLDATPRVMNTAGMGAAGDLYEVDDYVNITAAATATIHSYYRIVRFPTWAKIKSVSIASDAALDTSATWSLGLDFNIAFSDSTTDNTPTALQGLIPTSANTGATTTFASPSSPNLIFGSNWKYTTANTAIADTSITFANISTTYSFLQICGQPLWESFGFTSSVTGQPQDPGGWFDFTVYVHTAAGTAGSGNFWCKITYVH